MVGNPWDGPESNNKKHPPKQKALRNLEAVLHPWKCIKPQELSDHMHNALFSGLMSSLTHRFHFFHCGTHNLAFFFSLISTWVKIAFFSLQFVLGIFPGWVKDLEVAWHTKSPRTCPCLPRQQSNNNIPLWFKTYFQYQTHGYLRYSVWESEHFTNFNCVKILIVLIDCNFLKVYC